jgi:putative glycosyltransferase (TIGR04372 family)
MILFLKILMFLIVTPIFLLIKLLSPVYLIRWHEIPSERIGHLAIESELYLCEKKLSINTPNKPYLDIFFPGKKISNNFLLKLYSRKFLVFPRFIIAPLCRLSREFSNILKIKDVHEIGNNTSGSYDSLNLIDQNPSFLNFTKKEISYGDEILNKMRVNTKKKIVLLLLRDNSYMSKEFPNTDNTYYDFRNFDINLFIPSVYRLIDLGYFVIRMGKFAEKKLQIDSENFLDYPFCDYKSEFLDIYLSYKCFFCISSGTGLQEVAKIFRKKLVQFDATLAGLPTNSKDYLILNKILINKKNMKKLSLKQIVEVGAHLFMETKQFERANILVKDNSEEEILDITNEIHMFANNQNYYDKDDHNLQKKFSSIFPKEARWHHGKMHGDLKAKYSINFLRKNKDWLN